jgi:8-amino-7-oxononanoate synthase
MSPSTSPLKKALQTHLSNRALTSSLRTLTLTPPTSVDFSSNDFLSLSTSALLKHAFHTELASASDPTLGVGSRGSRLLDGNSEYAESLEKEIADFHHAPAGLLFNSGFDGNAGFFACVPQPGDVVLYDEFIHASVHEGMRLSRAGACVPFRHNCVSDLERRIEELNGKDESVRGGKKNIFVAVESLYSMDGDLSPLRRIVEVVERTLPGGNGHVIVDEAHSTGVYGEKGRGIVCMLGLEKRVFARLHTFGKALGCNGCKGSKSPSGPVTELTQSILSNHPL